VTNKQYIFGLHAVEALLLRQPERILSLLVHEGRRDKKIEDLLQLAKSQGLGIEFATRQTMDRVTGDANHQGMIVFCVPAHAYSEAELLQRLTQSTVPPFLLILDGVQDPHNLGACFRTADAAGVHAIIAPKDKSVGITPVVSKVACGATETVPFVQVTNLARTMEQLKALGIWLYGAAAEAEKSIYQTDLKGPVAIVMGAEGTGLRRLTREHCDDLMMIPMCGSVSSLNISVATGICLFEVKRKQFG